MVPSLGLLRSCVPQGRKLSKKDAVPFKFRGLMSVNTPNGHDTRLACPRAAALRHPGLHRMSRREAGADRA